MIKHGYGWCPVCEIKFKKLTHNHKYCSQSCRNKYKKIYEKECELCGGSFKTEDRSVKSCSKSCAISLGQSTRQNYGSKNNKKDNNYGEMTCKECKKHFIKSYINQKFCKPECTKKYHKKKQKEIIGQNRFEILERDGFRCQYCGRTPDKNNAELVVDHIYPISKGGQADYHNLITACRECNKQKHNRILPLQLTLRYWENSCGTYTYEEAKEYFENNLKNRQLRLATK